MKPGVQVVTPNPFSSGSARWNLVAAYGAELQLGRTPAQAQAYLKQLLTNTVGPALERQRRAGDLPLRGPATSSSTTRTTRSRP